MKHTSTHHHVNTSRSRRGFTLIEVMLAAVITAFVLGSITMTISQLGRAKDTSKLRLDAHLRAEHAINAIRRDIASVVRHDDLFWTRLLIREGTTHSPIGDMARDEILVFNTRLTAIADLDFHGEGMQYETQYRVEETHHGSMLWQRRDAVPDEFPLAGGIATPLAENVVALMVEAYDGWGWTSHWDSDERGLPLAVRVTVGASGARSGEELYEAPIVQLRTVVPIDRVMPPVDRMRPTEEDIDEMLLEVEDVTDMEAAAAARAAGGGARGGAKAGAPGGPIRFDGPETGHIDVGQQGGFKGGGFKSGGGGVQPVGRPGFGGTGGQPQKRPQVWTRGKGKGSP